MAYELVDAVQLNNDLLDIADAIRAKSQGQDPLLFPSEFISEIGSIPTGASITGTTDVTAKALETIAQNDSVYLSGSWIDTRLLPEPPIAGNGNGCAWNPDDTRLAICCYASPYLYIYNTTTTPYTKLSNPGALPAGYGVSCAWNPDGTRLAVTCTNSPRIMVYNTTTTPYTKLSNPGTLPTGAPGARKSCAWSPDGTKLAVAHSTSPFITIYDTTTTPYTKIANPSTLPAGNGNSCAWSPDGTRLAVSHSTSPFITIYDTTTTPYTKLADPSTLPKGTGACAWSPDGTRLVTTHATSPFITIYDTTTTPYTKIANPSTLPSGQIYSCSWNSSGSRLVVTGTTTPKAIVYDTTTTPYTKIADLKEARSSGNDIDWSNDNEKIVIAAIDNNGYGAAIYNASNQIVASKASNTIEQYDGGDYGYSKQSIAKGNTGTFGKIFSR